MIGEPDAGKPHVRFDEGAQETLRPSRRACALLYSVPALSNDPFLICHSGPLRHPLARYIAAGVR